MGRGGSRTDLTINLFGPMRVLVEGAELPPLRSRKALWLLAVLVLRQGRRVERDWLASLLWPDAEHTKAFANLRAVLSELRQALGSQGYRIQSPDRRSLEMDLEGAEIDLVEFENALATPTLASLQSAVDIYQGHLLEGCPEEWVPQERAAREHKCIQALLQLGDSAHAAQDFPAAQAWFQRAIQIDPWRDAPRRGLMEAFAAGGDTNEALQVYRQFEDHLKGEARTVPDQQTTDLYLRLRAEAKTKTRETPPAPTTIFAGSLPHPFTDLVGREDERIEVASLLRRSRLVTLTGLGGIGKTRLAVAVAKDVVRDYPHGVTLVSLEAIQDESDIPRQIGQALSLSESPDQPWMEIVVGHLAEKRMILVLDNCEHLLRASAQAVSAILQSCAGVRILATSRESLGIPGETAWYVPGLAVPNPNHLPAGSSTLRRVVLAYEGVQLFIERAQAARPNFAVNAANVTVIAQICAYLEGIPLAIELAAARVRSMPLEEIAERLQTDFALLATTGKSIVIRQQALKATLDWSYNTLTAEEKNLFARLSVFAGGWTLPAAESLAEDQPVPDLLASLVDKSLIRFEDQDDSERYRMVEMVRHFASEKLVESGEQETIRAKHRHWCALFAERAAAGILGVEQPRWMRALIFEYDNFRHALAFAPQEESAIQDTLRLAGALWRYWYSRGQFVEGKEALERVLHQDARAIPTPALALSLHGLGVMHFRLGEFTEAEYTHRQALAIREAIQDHPGIVESRFNLANIASQTSRREEAIVLWQDCIQDWESLGNHRMAGLALGNLGTAEIERGHYQAGRDYYERSWKALIKNGDPHTIVWAESQLANADQDLGHLAEAQARHESCLQTFIKMGDKRAIAWTLHKLGAIAFDRGTMPEAEEKLNQANDLFVEISDPQGLAWTHLGLANVHLWRNDLKKALERIESAHRLFQQEGNERSLSRSHLALAVYHLQAGDLMKAESEFLVSIQMLQRLRDLGGMEVLEYYSRFLAARNQPSRAAIVLGFSAQIRAQIAHPASPLEQKEIEKLVQSLQGQLGPSFDSRWQTGANFSWDQIFEQILTEPEPVMTA